jgi:c-di-GMP phosphodiesterase
VPEKSAANEIFIARQPIYDRQVEVYAYELLFRDGEGNFALVADGEAATARVIGNAFTEMGLEAIVDNRLASINVTRRFILDSQMPPLAPERMVLEILEDVEVDDQLVEAVRRFKRQGYTIALDDFTFSEAVKPLLEVAHMVKLDVRQHEPAALEAQLRLLLPFGKKIVAEKVESYDEFEACKLLGIDYFQGDFFCKPKILRQRAIPSNKLAQLKLIAQLNSDDADFDEVEKLISRDVGLSFKLLRYINSAFFSLPQKVGSVRQAMVLLGLQAIKRWSTLLVMAGVDDKPHELIVTALIRAHMCELLAPSQVQREHEEHFTVGMFSVVEALMDAPMETIIVSLPLSDELKIALAEQEGPKGRVLGAVLAFESGDFERLVELAPRVGVSLQDAYNQSVAWASEASRDLER